MINLTWLDERIPRLEKMNWLYNFACFCLGAPKKKLTYKQYIILLYGINRKKIGEREAKAGAITKAIETYKWLHNGEMPDMAELENDEQ